MRQPFGKNTVVIHLQRKMYYVSLRDCRGETVEGFGQTADPSAAMKTARRIARETNCKITRASGCKKGVRKRTCAAPETDYGVRDAQGGG